MDLFWMLQSSTPPEQHSTSQMPNALRRLANAAHHAVPRLASQDKP